MIVEGAARAGVVWQRHFGKVGQLGRQPALVSGGVNVNVLSQQNQAVDCTQRTTQDVEQALAAL